MIGLSSYILMAALAGMGFSSYLYSLSASCDFGSGVNYAMIEYAHKRNRRGKIIRRMRSN
jgi:hypothetical protein